MSGQARLSEAEIGALAIGVHEALRCNCDSGLRDDMVAEELAPVVERILTARSADLAARVEELAKEWDAQEQREAGDGVGGERRG